MNLSSRLTVLSLLISPVALAAPVDLEPPDVTNYLEVQLSKTELDPLLDESDTGFKVLFGMQSEQLKLGSWRWAGEGGLNLLANTTTRSQLARDTRTGEFPGFDRVIFDNRDELTISGFELGARLVAPRFFHVRAGLYIHSLKTKSETVRTLVESPPATGTETAQLSPTSESKSSSAPYLGAGVRLPLDDSFELTADYTIHRIDDESLDSLSAGFRLMF